jgi:6-phosphogluconate dehydrogenase
MLKAPKSKWPLSVHSNIPNYNRQKASNLYLLLSLHWNSPGKILLMLPAGAALDQFLEDLIPLLSPGDLLIDGGNSHFLDTEKRAKMLKAKKILFLGMGVSGGEKGALEGPSLMLGEMQKLMNEWFKTSVLSPQKIRREEPVVAI